MRIAPNRRMRAAAALTFACVSTLLAGCATFGGPESAVKSRANDFWQARLEGRPDKAYQLTAPSYREVRDLQQYRVRNAGLGAKAVEVERVTCEAERCVARIKMAVVPPIVAMNMAPIEMYSDDVWVLEDGNWWHFEAP
ncbi:hypothetical protein [Acidovorax sp. Leaf160]|uniref:hypothetical protein n=1 Tax=Acidovorax sp. Leaf160 TaxID=1736280 RepID=UPI000B1C735F|nr:hypothetical protein [Acidovorax sp. Leaf160]